ncbi:MAG: FISUMP domain-containing protein [Candidatus Celaenobacter antarcticus]|nr:FISUMP domain-containing protein [Candidatus Celaenobacter antarcticus]
MKKILLIILTTSILFVISCNNTTESDNTPPSIVITHPVNNSEFVEGTEITITVDATDNKEVDKVEFYIDGSKVSTDNTEPYEYEWDTGTAKNTTHTIYAKAYDTSDNSSTSDVITVTITEGTGTVTDIDGNVYHTIIIDNQEWMMENLKVTHYRNGDSILTGYSNTEWTGLSSGAYCVYDNDPSNCDTYGNLYNWYAVDEDDSRGLAPEGWHVPTDDEWQILVNYLGGSSVAGGKMKSTGTIEGGDGLWYEPNTGATNASGFTALPGGYRYYGGYYYGMGGNGYFWSSTENSSNLAWYLALHYSYTTICRSYYDKHYGMSVRCVRD